MVLYYDYHLLATIFVGKKTRKKILINAHTDTQFVMLLEEKLFKFYFDHTIFCDFMCNKQAAVSNYF